MWPGYSWILLFHSWLFLCVGVLQYADGSHFVWPAPGCDKGFGSVVIWLPGCLVGLVSASEILGLLGLYKVRSGCVVVESGLSAIWSGYSWVVA